MPGGDRTGPGGMGPMTGRAAGYCAGYPTPGFMNPVGGRGFGGGFGGGRGFGRGFRGGRGYGYGAYPAAYSAAYPAAYPAGGFAPGYAPGLAQMTPEQEAEGLKAQVSYFEDSLKAIQERIAELEKAAKAK